jgi:hypothetical protein
MNRVFWVGVYPGLTDAAVQFMIESFHDAIAAGASSNGHGRVAAKSQSVAAGAQRAETASG